MHSIQPDNNRTIYFDVLRILSAFAVVFLHVSGNVLSKAALGSFGWYVLNFYHGITWFCVPMFVMISGALFLDPSREITLKRLFCHNIFRLLVAFLFWKIIYMGVMIIVEPETLNASFLTLAKKAITERYHLWFIRMLIGLYIATPILRKISADKKTLEYFLILSFIFCYCVTLAGMLPKVGDTAIEFFSSYYIPVAFGYSGYYCMGYYLHKYDVSLKARKAIYVMGALSFLLTVAITCFMSLRIGYTNRELYNNLLPTTCFMSASVFLLVKNSKNIARICVKYRERVLHFSALTFGTYQVHLLFLITLDAVGVDALLFEPIASAPLLCVLVFALSMLLSYLIRKVPLFRRYIA